MTARTLHRRTDPVTSRRAAQKVEPRRLTVRAAVHLVLIEEGPLTHDALVKAYGARASTQADWPITTASSIRTRCKELERDGLVEVTEGLGKSRYGNAAHLWRAVDVQGTETIDLHRETVGGVR